jgi:hypothetical protein
MCLVLGCHRVLGAIWALERHMLACHGSRWVKMWVDTETPSGYDTYLSLCKYINRSPI